MSVVLSEHAGFCFGVKKAVDAARDAVDRYAKEGRAVYSCGSLIHNEHVINTLRKEGLQTVDLLEDVPVGSVLVVRSHGESKDFFIRAQEKTLTLIDTTCPRVRHIQNLVSDASAEGTQIIIVGNREHPEVQGINGWCENTALILETREEAEACLDLLSCGEKNFLVVCQTTFEKDRYDEIVKTIQNANNTRQINVKDTICNATTERQTACARLASEVDAMIIVGDKNSSNTHKLFAISKARCPHTFFVEKLNDLPLKDVENCNRIGITAGASTPDWIIKEVLTGMNEFKNESNELNPMHEFMDEIDKALKLPRNGDIVTGEVIQVTEKDVIVNIGCKKDGIIPRNEVTLESDQTLLDLFKEGDEVQAKVLKTDDGDGNILLSKKRVIISEHWADINQALEDKEILEVLVTKEVNGGVIASFHEINGFIPMSQLSDRYVEKADEFVGQTLSAKVMRVDQRRNKVVFSHKAVLNEERAKRMTEIWDTINVGDVIDGKVMRFTEYGAFIDIGGIDGLLHISEISWGKLRHPSEVLTIDQEISVKVLSMNREKEKISLGYKQNLPEPWTVIGDKYTEGQIITGRAVQLKDYGVFVELEPGLDGLVHISEIAFKRVNNISEELTVGQTITAKILEIDQERKRISLSIKETLDREEEEAKEAAREAAEAAKDTELEMPDPDAVPDTKTADDAVATFEAEAVKDTELEMPDPDAPADVATLEDAKEAFGADEETAPEDAEA
ncbi:MAG: bifunctional 4-hydroxy-3-methylbut-2-enyl diphosphate reductase/30S ribosomal protein S1 [Clostridiales Family XIII bacterium]|jgi:4-hydroxy-3-methylbut-2-enyl diphosphate reductase|nr:bifunctional 4-hydroxy-3-methylbut-2-enyl diphosphate reductase/30S ribosomal protein S1 [Clostridiales Family XIII bacterium]